MVKIGQACNNNLIKAQQVGASKPDLGRLLTGGGPQSGAAAPPIGRRLRARSKAGPGPPSKRSQRRLRRKKTRPNRGKPPPFFVLGA